MTKRFWRLAWIFIRDLIGAILWAPTWIVVLLLAWPQLKKQWFNKGRIWD